MWFKQLSFFIINPKLIPSNEVLDEQLSTRIFAPITGLSWFSEGFCQPVSFSQGNILPIHNTVLMRLRKEERVLPSSVIREALEEKVHQIQQTENRTLSRKECRALKEEITDELLPRAFTKNSYVDLIFEKNNGFLLVNQLSNTKVENALSALRHSVEGLIINKPNTLHSLPELMNEWLLEGQVDNGHFTLDDYCELKGKGERAATVRVSNQDISTEEVIAHIRHGKTVSRLGLCWQDKISFVLSRDLTIARIKFLDVIQNEVAEQGEDIESLTKATLMMNAQSLSDMLCELIEILGGLTE